MPAGPIAGPCAPYATLDDVRASGCSDDPPTDADLTTAISFASRVMYLATGRQFDGTCTAVALRPCGCQSCCAAHPTVGALISGSSSGCGGACAGSRCGCTPLQEFDLSQLGVIQSVDRVSVDGVTLTPDVDFRVDDWRWLVRLDGDGLPVCPDLEASVDGPGVWSIDVTYGVAAPPTVVQGTAALACELAKAAIGQKCSLPARVTNIARQGIDMSLLDPQLFFESSPPRTGVYLADLAIVQENPDGLTVGGAFVSPDRSPSTRRIST